MSPADAPRTMFERPEPPALASHWRLDPGTVYLNHGSFGACPTPVLDAQRALRDRMEADGVRFFTAALFGLLDRTRDALASVINASPGDIVLGPNATWGVATVLHNIEPTLAPGDELLSSPHEYPSCRAMLARTAERTDARVVEVQPPWPVPDADAIIERYLDAVTDRTRLCLLSRVTSPTAVVLPVERLVPALRERAVETILDAAHAPGYLPLDVTAIGAAYTTANAHKWLCAPKGAALLHVRPDRQPGFRPMILSVHTSPLDSWAKRLGRSPFALEFDYTGTDDPTARLAIPDAIGFLASLDPDGLRGVMRANRDLCLRGRDAIADTLGIESPVPDDLLGPMAPLELPAHPAFPLPADPTDPTAPDPLKTSLLERHGIQVPVFPGPDPSRPARVLRISAQRYNSIEQYEYLARCLNYEYEHAG